MVKFGNLILYKWNINKQIWFYWVLKYISWLIIRLKTIKYKKDFFCYLSFYLDLDF